MTKSLVFPGQWSQKIGMGKEFFDNFQIAKEVFQNVDDCLSQNLSKLIFDGPLDELTLTENAQPAIMTVPIAILEVLKIAITQEMGSYYGSVFERYAIREKMRMFFEKYDLLITPTLPCPAFKAGQNVPENFPDRNIVSWVYYTYPFNLTKNPACNINVNYSKSGLPIGMQIGGDIYDDKTCFELAFLIEEIMDISDKWPNL